MTFIQPHRRRSRFTLLISFLGLIVFGGIVGMVLVQNHTVTLKHAIAKTKIETQDTQAETAQLQAKLFAVINNDALQQFAYNHNLVIETKPTYMDISAQWASASQ